MQCFGLSVKYDGSAKVFCWSGGKYVDNAFYGSDIVFSE